SGSALASFANGEGYETAAIIQDNSTDYGQNLSATFEEEYQGNIVANESYIAGDSDFNSILNNIASDDPDVIFIAGYYSEGGPIVKQAREKGIDAVRSEERRVGKEWRSRCEAGYEEKRGTR